MSAMSEYRSTNLSGCIVADEDLSKESNAYGESPAGTQGPTKSDSKPHRCTPLPLLFQLEAILVEAGEVALALLKLTVASSDWNPPLKAATGGALHIAELIKVSAQPGVFKFRSAHARS
jgi:hypothetical protein